LIVECDSAVLKEITDAFRFNDAVLRHLTLSRNEAVTAASPMALAVEEEKVKDRESQRRRDAKAAAETAMLSTSDYELDAVEGSDDDELEPAEEIAEEEAPAEVMPAHEVVAVVAAAGEATAEQVDEATDENSEESTADAADEPAAEAKSA
jgi:small subunit ribosomal protein S6